MLCDYCKKREAIFFLEQSTKNSKKRIHLCMQCAVKTGISPDPERVQQSIKTLFAEVEKLDAERTKDSETLCPVCGTSLSRIKKTLRVGCSECYEVFKKTLPSIFSAHGIRGPYRGSMPERLGNFRSRLTDRIDLEAKLEESIRNEDYEKAALYRDYLRALEKNSVSGSEQDS